MDLVVLHMDFPLVVHVVDSSFPVVGLLVDRLEQFSQLLPILVGDVREVVAQEAHLELVSSNLLVVVPACSPLENCQTFFVVEVLIVVVHHPTDVVADSSLVVFLVVPIFSDQINRI